MKAHKRPTAHGNPGRGAGHHIVVACPMIALIVADGADDGQLVGNRGQLRQFLTVMDTGNAGLNRVEFPSDLFGSVRFGVECLVVGRASIEPDQDARSGLGSHHPRLGDTGGNGLG